MHPMRRRLKDTLMHLAFMTFGTFPAPIPPIISNELSAVLTAISCLCSSFNSFIFFLHLYVLPRFCLSLPEISASFAFYLSSNFFLSFFLLYACQRFGLEYTPRSLFSAQDLMNIFVCFIASSLIIFFVISYRCGVTQFNSESRLIELKWL